MANVYRLEYETSEFSYKFHVAATSMEEAQEFLRVNIKKQFKINTIQEICRIDAITKEALPLVLVETVNTRSVLKENEREWKCPWCGDDFKNELGLKIHIGRSHK